MGFRFFRGATRQRRDSKELKDEIDPAQADAIKNGVCASRLYEIDS